MAKRAERMAIDRLDKWVPIMKPIRASGTSSQLVTNSVGFDQAGSLWSSGGAGDTQVFEAGYDGVAVTKIAVARFAAPVAYPSVLLYLSAMEISSVLAGGSGNTSYKWYWIREYFTLETLTYADWAGLTKALATNSTIGVGLRGTPGVGNGRYQGDVGLKWTTGATAYGFGIEPALITTQTTYLKEQVAGPASSLGRVYQLTS